MTTTTTTAGRTVLNHNDLPWRDSPYPGVAWKKLAFDKATGRSAVLLRFAPGARYGAHRHPRGERYLVLEGTLDDGGTSYGAGTYVELAPGSAHRPSSQTGCVLFVALEAPIEVIELSGDTPRPGLSGDTEGGA